MTRMPWKDDELQILMQCYHVLPTTRLSIILGRTARSIYCAADRCGLVQHRTQLSQQVIDLVQVRHREEWLDSEIAADWTVNNHDRPIDRRTICSVRKSLGLPSNRTTKRYRDQVRQRTMMQLKLAGVQSLVTLRQKRYRRFASDRGWPESLSPREVQIVDMLYELGSMTRRQIVASICLDGEKQRKWLSCRHGRGSYLANLMYAGLVVRSTHKTVKGIGKGHSVYTYSCATWVQRGADWSKRWTETVAEA